MSVGGARRTEVRAVPYVLGALVGAAVGGAAGVLKYLFLWRPWQKKPASRTEKSLYLRMLISNGVNVVVLVGLFLLRNVLPFPFYAVIIAAALALSVSGKLCSIARLPGPADGADKS